jgi:D-alanine-D-alanine ligase
MKVVLLHDDIAPDARLDELDVFVQADAIAAALAELGHTAVRLPFALDLRGTAAALRNLDPGVVFNLVEAIEGRGRLVHLATSLLDLLGLPYTGTTTTGMFLTANKILTKRWLAAHGLPTPGWCTAAGAAGGLRFPGRFIIKSVWEEASLGLEDDSVLSAVGLAELGREIQARTARLGGEAFAEEYINGREFNLALLAGQSGPQVLPPAEIHFLNYASDKPRVVGYRAKWDEHSFEYHHTPRSFDFPPADAALLAELERLARRCWELFELGGYARVDFRVDESGRPWVLEINTNPCLSPDAGFPAAAQRAGLSFAAVIDRIVADALRVVRE